MINRDYIAEQIQATLTERPGPRRPRRRLSAEDRRWLWRMAVLCMACSLLSSGFCVLLAHLLGQ